MEDSLCLNVQIHIVLQEFPTMLKTVQWFVGPLIVSLFMNALLLEECMELIDISLLQRQLSSLLKIMICD